MEVVGIGRVVLLGSGWPAEVGRPVAVLGTEPGPHDDHGAVGDGSELMLPLFQVVHVDHRVGIRTVGDQPILHFDT